MYRPSVIRNLLAFAVTVAVNSHSCTGFSPFQQIFGGTSQLSTSSAYGVPPIQAANPNNPLIQRANEFIYAKSGFYSESDPEWLSDDFVFRGPYIGPLNKSDYLSTMKTFGIWKAIPDISPNAFGFTIDPTDTNRVWFFVKNTGTFTGEDGFRIGDLLTLPPTGDSLEGAPETFSIIFDGTDEKRIKGLSVGYVNDRFEGNTNGDGAAVGIFRVIGLPFPKGPGPFLRFAQWFATEVYNVGAYAYSKDVPKWWTDKSTTRGAD